MPAANSHTAKRIVKAVLAGIAAGILLCELCMRIYNPTPSAIRNGKLLLPANQHKIFTNTWISKLDRQIHYSKNSLGFRGPELPAGKAPVLSIVTVGGSTTECKYLSDSSTWPFQLYLKLHGADPKVWLNNAGIDGHTSFGHITLISEYIIKLKPRYLLLMTGVNDVELDAPDEFDLASSKKINTGSAKAFLKSLANQTELGRAFLNYFQLHVSFKKGLMHREINLPALADNPLSENVMAARLIKQEPYLRQYGRRIDRIIRLCVGAGIQPILITQPSLYGDYTDPDTGVKTGNKWFARDPNGENCLMMKRILELYNDVLRSFSGKVPVIDLAEKMKPRSSYFYDFTHVTNTGAATIASILATELPPILYKK
ncbi:MAG: SGNH/GDSL hydrolase family protein [Bacteroidetes bacterium]|nr:SGNH/GDSL hydrolase family protein [Bacteroidota bacterium]